MAFENNWQAILNGHTNFGGGDPPAGGTSTRPGLDVRADIRDMLSGAVGKGWTNFSDPEAQKHFARLTVLVGRQQAQSLMNHVFIYNQRPDVKGKSADQKLSQFYDMGSTNKDTNNIIKAAGSFGQGAVEGQNTSRDITNMQNTGRDNTPAATGKNTSQTDKLKSMVENTLK